MVIMESLSSVPPRTDNQTGKFTGNTNGLKISANTADMQSRETVWFPVSNSRAGVGGVING
jgi:hypothetical protein